MKTIVQKSGFRRRRCERAVASLKKMGLIEVYPPGRHGLASKAVKYSGSRSVRAVTPSFFEYLIQIGFFIRSEPAPGLKEDMA
jgi:hypothetical protein